jgi:hypothetical protein
VIVRLIVMFEYLFDHVERPLIDIETSVFDCVFVQSGIRIARMQRALVFAVLLACGGSNPPPAPTPTQTQNSPDASMVSPTETDSGASPIASASTAPAIADAGAPAPTTTADGPDQATMVCGSTAMPFEQKVRPEIKKCFFEAKAKNPALSGKVKVVLNVGSKGTLGAINIVDAKELGKDAVDCMTKAVKAAKPDVSTCKDKKVEMQMAFGAAAK